HLAQLAHDQEGNEAANGIAEDHRRTGALHDPRRAQEQAGANGSAQGDQLDMTVLQPAGERPGLQRIVTHEKSLWGNPEAPHLRTNAGGIVVKRRALYTRKRGRKPPPLGSDILTHPPPGPHRNRTPCKAAPCAALAHSPPCHPTMNAPIWCKKCVAANCECVKDRSGTRISRCFSKLARDMLSPG